VKRAAIFIVVGVFLAGVPASNAERPRLLTAIEILSSDDETPIARREYKNLSSREVIDHLELEEKIENQTIVLHPVAGTNVELKVEQRFETSLTVMDEGPHLDLTGWKHYRSAWVDIKRLGENRFLTSRVDPSEYSRFPRTTPAEIRQAVLAAGGRRWARLVRNVRNPNDYPAAVDVSRISLRVSVKDGSLWRPLVVVHIDLPMGC
jgi:hypothetical protein